LVVVAVVKTGFHRILTAVAVAVAVLLQALVSL
jgi:hypothetical protein